MFPCALSKLEGYAHNTHHNSQQSTIAVCRNMAACQYGFCTLAFMMFPTCGMSNDDDLEDLDSFEAGYGHLCGFSLILDWLFRDIWRAVSYHEIMRYNKWFKLNLPAWNGRLPMKMSIRLTQTCNRQHIQMSDDVFEWRFDESPSIFTAHGPSMQRAASAFTSRNLLKTYYNRIKAEDVALYAPALPKVCKELLLGYLEGAAFAWDCVWHVLEFVDIWNKYDAVLLHEANQLIGYESDGLDDIDVLNTKGFKRKEPHN